MGRGACYKSGGRTVGSPVELRLATGGRCFHAECRGKPDNNLTRSTPECAEGRGELHTTRDLAATRPDLFFGTAARASHRWLPEGLPTKNQAVAVEAIDAIGSPRPSAYSASSC